MNAQDLKNSILQLAIQGKLVEQREDEGTAKELLQLIVAEKEQLLKDKKIKKQKPLPEITPDEIPFEVPESWEWVRLNNIALYIKAGGDKPKDFTTIKSEIYSIPVIANGVKNDGIIGYTKNATVEDSCITISGRGTIGFSCLRTEPFTPVVRLIVLNISKQIEQKYIQMVLSALLERGVGTSIKQLTVPMLEPKLLPLPPLEEQKRIIKKYEELMAHVEKYDTAYSEVVKLNKKFPENMQKSILQYAIQGKLVEQREEEGTAEETYKKIQEEKIKLIEGGKIKKTKALPEITQDEIPFEIPESWKWVRLSELGYFSSGKTPSMFDKENWDNGTIPWVTSKDMKSKYLRSSTILITKKARDNMTIYPEDTLLMVVRSGILKRMLPLAILKADSTINQDIKAFSLYDKTISEYVYICLKAMETYILNNYRKRVTTVDSLKFDEFQLMPIPIPPLKEQKRIEMQLDNALRFCENLIK